MFSAGLLFLAACGRDADGDPGLEVVATTTQAADFARAVGGEKVEVRSLLRPGGDPHDYEPRPSHVREVAEANLVVRSGGEVDEWLDELLEEAGGSAQTVTLLDAAGGRDPHWWQDPRTADAAVAAIGRGMSKADPGGGEGYSQRAGDYRRRLRALDRGIAGCMDMVPVSRRKLVTTHDSLRRFADRYGLEVVGTLIPGRSTEAQPSAGEVDRLASRMKEEEVPAIFPESGVRPKLERALARESGAEVGDALYADTLGRRGSGAETYLRAMASNTQALVEGMTGGMRSCRPPVR